MSSSTFPTSSKQAGERGEAAVIEAVDELAPVSDSVAEHYDAVSKTAIGASRELPFAGIALVERDIPIEIKTCIPRLTSGQRGRFYLRREQHDSLAEDGGLYLFAVVKPHAREPLAMKVAPARSVGDVVPSWRAAGEDRYTCAQVSWGRVFRASEVSDDS